MRINYFGSYSRGSSFNEDNENKYNFFKCFRMFPKGNEFYFKLLYDVKGNLFSKIPIWITKTN